MSFSERLQSAIMTKKNPIIVGLDPRLESLPRGMCDPEEKNPEVIAAAFERFCKEVVDTVAPLVPCVKPQAAFFERYGHFGARALERTIHYAHEKGLLVILDGKRNDIGSTAEAYAEGMIGSGTKSIWGADALTVNPYLGDDSLEPFVNVARARNGGIFVLVKTSNPGGATFQDLMSNGKPVYQYVGEYVQSLALKSKQDNVESCNYGSIGAVVGATWPEQLKELRRVMLDVWFLVPGFGAQGGAAKDVAEAFDRHGLGAVINNSRGIIFAYRREPFASKFGQTQWQRAVEAATLEMIDHLQTDTPVGRLK